MLRSVFGKTLWDQRRGLLGWSLGVLAFVALSLAFYPAIRTNATQFQEVIDQMPEALRTLFLGEVTDITSPVGYLNGRLFATTVPVLYLVFAISAGTRAIAGEEEAHTLDLLLSMPISRRRIVLEKLAAIGAALMGLSVMLWLSLVVLDVPFGLDVGLGALAAATVHLFALSAMFGALGLALGVLTGRRAVAGGVTTAIAVAGFVLASIAPLTPSTAWLRFLSPVHYYSGETPLLHGIDPGGLAVLTGLTVVLLVAGVVLFDRRDVRA
jgi:ABC-2 type transport system permease protein